MRCFCGVRHCKYSRVVAAQTVREWVRSLTAEDRAKIAKGATAGILAILRAIGRIRRPV